MNEINVQQAMKLTFITSLITNLEVGQLKTHLNKCVWAVKKKCSNVCTDVRQV